MQPVVRVDVGLVPLRVLAVGEHHQLIGMQRLAGAEYRVGGVTHGLVAPPEAAVALDGLAQGADARLQVCAALPPALAAHVPAEDLDAVADHREVVAAR